MSETSNDAGCQVLSGDSLTDKPGKIGIFDSGYGGLTILRDIVKLMPGYEYLYLGDNARAPYGQRSFDIVYDFTVQAVEYLFAKGCHLVILACNTASAKALRSIQQNVLPLKYPGRRVLGVIRPTAEVVGNLTESRHIGVLATPGTAASHSYRMEIKKLFPDIEITELGCPMWTPLVEAAEADSPGADYFVKKYLKQIMDLDPLIDAIVLGCTHYPLLINKIMEFGPGNVNIIAQGNLVAESLADYLRRHPEIEEKCLKGGSVEYLTTENPEKFNSMASIFVKDDVVSKKITLK